MSAIVSTIFKKNEETGKVIDAMVEMSRMHHDLAMNVANGILRDKLSSDLERERWYRTTIDNLADANRPALRQISAPVGKSVRTLEIGHTEITHIDEAGASVLSSKEDMDIGDLAEYRVTIHGVFKTDGSCRLKLYDTQEITIGRITDPALETVGNVYTSALNQGFPLVITAKPTIKDGKIVRLYISDAKKAA